MAFTLLRLRRRGKGGCVAMPALGAGGGNVSEEGWRSTSLSSAWARIVGSVATPGGGERVALDDDEPALRARRRSAASTSSSELGYRARPLVAGTGDEGDE